nr:hypothetical protein [uncultured Lichenicoccus sp.]
MAASGLAAFSKSPDHAVWLVFYGYQRRLYVAGAGQASLPIEAWSGGGQTNARNVERRHQVEMKHKSHVPTHDFPFNPFQGISNREVSVTDHRGKQQAVHSRRGGVLPPGEWIAVAKGAPGYPQHLNSKLGDFPTWWLCPYRIGNEYATVRDLNTFYIHVSGFLGSDGCIVMSPDYLTILACRLGNRPYTVLRSTVFEGTELDGRCNVSHMV